MDRCLLKVTGLLTGSNMRGSSSESRLRGSRRRCRKWISHTAFKGLLNVSQTCTEAALKALQTKGIQAQMSTVGYGFVDFESNMCAEAAVKALQAKGIQAQMAKVGITQPRAPASVRVCMQVFSNTLHIQVCPL
ncbi:hypothetical protein J6590_064412 [Homalodisca vitripennis]|nr:hypothetical protein J6590_064412 [Homalodisca vitripennis]